MQDKANTGVVRCGVMGLPFDLETRLEQELPLRLQGSFQEHWTSTALGAESVD